mmetsp:Transcript_52327/g.104816  ORF Transcript_52327/g.104816 Transcript_52327/m.104816 type:complete len:178 (+) Transcript_52327:363-896(+)
MTLPGHGGGGRYWARQRERPQIDRDVGSDRGAARNSLTSTSASCPPNATRCTPSAGTRQGASTAPASLATTAPTAECGASRFTSATWASTRAGPARHAPTPTAASHASATTVSRATAWRARTWTNVPRTHACSGDAACWNDIGTYGCSCNTGYSGDGFSCSDVNECSLDAHDCHADA